MEIPQNRAVLAVIASEAKQSIKPRSKSGLLRRFAPRNDGSDTQCVKDASVRREAVEQAVATGRLEVGLRAAAVRSARGMRGVPGFRSVVVAQANAVGMTEHRGPLRAARPVLAGAVVGAGESGAVRLR